VPFRRSLPADSAGYHPRVRAVATVAAHLRDHAADVAWLGSEEVIAERLARDRAALHKYTATGETAMR
jgi:hypothetical protein